jgi:hypothetical protein
MWVKIKDNITTDLWYKNHKGEIFEVFKIHTVSDYFNNNHYNPNDYYYSIKSNNFHIDPEDAIVIEPRREKINKIKNKL